MRLCVPVRGCWAGGTECFSENLQETISIMTEIADKMAVRGVESLTDRELLTALVEDGRLAGALLDAYGGSLARMADEAEARLRLVGGLGLRRARLL